jgi:hypothetical protein
MIVETVEVNQAVREKRERRAKALVRTEPANFPDGIPATAADN